MSLIKVTVKYISPDHDIDINLDREVELFFKGLGFTWLGSGIHCVNPFERTIDFEKEWKV